MKSTSTLLGASCLFFLVLAIAQEHKYTTKYDDIDIEAVIGNERLLNSYVGCLLDRKACSPDAAELKMNLPDALATDCSSCSEAQKRISDRLSHHLIDNRPEDWALLEEKYDPTGDYRARYLHSQEMDRLVEEEAEKIVDNNNNNSESSISSSDKDE